MACVADEEHASLGVQEVLKHVHADAAIVTEPTRHEFVVAHKGFVWGDVRVEGTAAHGSRPELGVDAIVRAAPILAGLVRSTKPSPPATLTRCRVAAPCMPAPFRAGPNRRHTLGAAR